MKTETWKDYLKIHEQAETASQHEGFLIKYALKVGYLVKYIHVWKLSKYVFLRGTLSKIFLKKNIKHTQLTTLFTS